VKTWYLNKNTVDGFDLSNISALLLPKYVRGCDILCPLEDFIKLVYYHRNIWFEQFWEMYIHLCTNRIPHWSGACFSTSAHYRKHTVYTHNNLSCLFLVMCSCVIFIIARNTAAVVSQDWEKECQNKKSNASELLFVIASYIVLVYICICQNLDFHVYCNILSFNKCSFHCNLFVCRQNSFCLFAEEDHEEIVIISIVGGILAILIIMLIIVFYSYVHRRHHRYQQMKDIQ